MVSWEGVEPPKFTAEAELLKTAELIAEELTDRPGRIAVHAELAGVRRAGVGHGRDASPATRTIQERTQERGFRQNRGLLRDGNGAALARKKPRGHAARFHYNFLCE